MNHLVNVTKKELRELFTPGAVASVVMIIVLFMLMGQAMSGQTDSISQPAEIGVVYQDETPDETVIYTCGTEVITYEKLVVESYKLLYPNSETSHIHTINAAYGDDQSIEKETSDSGYKYTIAIPSALKDNINASKCVSTDIPTYYVYKSGGIFSSVSSSTSTQLISYMSQYLSKYIIANHSEESPSDVYGMMNPVYNSSTHTYINGKVYSNITPYEITSTQMGQTFMIPIVVMLVITMVGSIVISSMGSEKENKTLETLLTMPVKRTTIVSGKLLAAALMGLFYGVCYLIGMMFYSNGLTSGLGSVNLNDYGLGMNMVGWITLFVILFLSIFSALGICMILGAFTKNYKMAQTMVMPVSVLAIIPMMILMFSDWNSLPAVAQGILFAIPFSHPMMALTNITLGKSALVIGGMVYLAVLDAVLIMITVRVYNSDVLITGIDKKRIMNKLKIPEKKRKIQ